MNLHISTRAHCSALNKTGVTSIICLQLNRHKVHKDFLKNKHIQMKFS